MPKIFLSPSNQYGNKYAWGNTNEGKQCGLIASLLKISLERCGFDVMLMHDESMQTKVAKANAWGADLYSPIHSNACNGKVGGTHLFCYSIPGSGYDACLCVKRYLGPISPGEGDSVSVRDDLYEVRMPYAPTVYVEIDFHDVPDIARWIVENTANIAEAICRGYCDYFKIQYVPVSDNKCEVKLPILRQGDANGYVYDMQILLNKKNKANLEEDGIFGPASALALKAFQRGHGLEDDEICGFNSWTALLK
jgi:N-acetylmuramoyl-L-alanine amidase